MMWRWCDDEILIILIFRCIHSAQLLLEVTKYLLCIFHIHFFSVEDDFYSLLVCIFSLWVRIKKSLTAERIKLIYIFKFCWIVCFILLLGISKSCKITDRGPVLDTLQIFLTGHLYNFNVYAIYISISTYSLYHNYIFSQRSFKNKTILYCSYLHN